MIGREPQITLAMNFAGIALLVLMLSTPGVLEDASLHAAGRLADTLAERDLGAASVSAVLGGAVITMFTWLAEAAESDLTRLFVALAVGFVLLGPASITASWGSARSSSGSPPARRTPTGSTWCATPRSRSWETSRGA